MPRWSRLIPVGILFLVLSGFLVGSPAPVQATQPLAFGTKYCSAPMGQIYCEANVNGGVTPYQWQWQGIENANLNSPTNWYTFGTCTIRRMSKVQLTVTDHAGSSISTTFDFYCLPIPWG